jgi:hypothetical protein
VHPSVRSFVRGNTDEGLGGDRWEDLESPALPGQWEQFKITPSTTMPDDLK